VISLTASEIFMFEHVEELAACLDRKNLKIGASRSVDSSILTEIFLDGKICLLISPSIGVHILMTNISW
jgi:hypothetical protein